MDIHPHPTPHLVGFSGSQSALLNCLPLILCRQTFVVIVLLLPQQIFYLFRPTPSYHEIANHKLNSGTTIIN